MNNLIIRTITGLAFVLIMVNSMIWNPYFFAALFLIILILAQIELHKILTERNKSLCLSQSLITSILIYLVNVVVANKVVSPEFLIIIPGLLLIIPVAELFRKTKDSFHNIAYSMLSVVYIVFPFSILNYFFNPLLEQDIFRFDLILGFFVILWISDTAAYLVGSFLGRRKLFERVSPNKTWEGSIGGLLFGVFTAYILSIYFHSA